MPLEEYQAKRDFSATPEPTGGMPSGRLRFVVQQHHARAMHYDFRLELDGVLLSWAIPKGPSFDPADRRLAVHVEDHPLDYADFEGIIPTGEYGAGHVIVWDRGTWEPVGDAHAGLAKGDFKFELAGEKLAGRWVLVRLRPKPGEKRENWLLIKERDDHARPRAEFDVTAEKTLSVISGVSVEEVGEGGQGVGQVPVVQVHGSDWNLPDPLPSHGGPSPEPQPVPGSLVAPPELALCTLVAEPPVGPDWIGEVKYDGYRVTVAVEGGGARCYSRNGEDWSGRLGGITRAASTLPVSNALLDGEIVVFDQQGASKFGLLQDALSSDSSRISFVAFDLLFLNDHDLTPLPTVRRKALLKTVLADEPVGPLVYAEDVEGDVDSLLEAACAQGLEGVVAKRVDSAYPRGRTHSWLKIKCRLAQELVIGGFTEPAAGRAGFGALLVGYYDGDRLAYAGRVGSGFSDTQLIALHKRLAGMERSTSPFDPPPTQLSAPHWVEPSLVAQVAFTEWTASGRLRQPSYKGLREDKAPRSVVRERPAEPDLGGSGGAGSGDCRALASPESAPPLPRDPAQPSGVRITNPDKQLFPGGGLSKLDLAQYYEAVAPWMLREVAGRPLTLVRCPVGSGSGKCFYQRHPDKGLSENVSALPYALTKHDDADEWLTIRDAAGLVSLAQMGVAEIHTWLSREDTPGRPDRIVLDLDPGPDVPWAQIVDAAFLLREACTNLGFEPFVKNTGSKGLHVVVPIEPVWEFERIRALAKTIADAAVSEDPTHLTSKMAKSQRGGRIFIDYVRNSEAASAVAPYSTRYLEGPPVAVPLAWDELRATDDLRRSFTPEVVMNRLASGVDPWHELDRAAAGVRILRSAEQLLSS